MALAIASRKHDRGRVTKEQTPSVFEPTEALTSDGKPKARIKRRMRGAGLRARPSGVPRFMLPLQRFFGNVIFSSLTRRILVLNIAGLVVLVSGILYLNQFREGLTDARVESLMTQGQIIAAAIASSASVETDALSIDPEALLELQAGEVAQPQQRGLDFEEFPVNPEQVAPILRRLISPTRTRARIFDRDADMILDSRYLYSGGQILRFQLGPLGQGDEPQSAWQSVKDWFSGLFKRSEFEQYVEAPNGDGRLYAEVRAALEGRPMTMVRVDRDNKIIVSVAVPIQRFRGILGVLMLSTQGSEIDEIIAAERMAIVRVALVAVLVTAILSILLASTIAIPLRKLSASAERVRRGVTGHMVIPDFSDRRDEIGNLSLSVRDMTQSLFDRIDEIEAFAADVAHELKNPLTSLRSAVETLPLARNEESRQRLLDVIQHDVGRLDRLISDISDASRLDAELARDDAEPVNMRDLLEQIAAAHLTQPAAQNGVVMDLIVPERAQEKSQTKVAPRFYVSGHDLRLGQVFANLTDNARTFVPQPGGRIALHLGRSENEIIIHICDNGKGIRPDNMEAIFQRFYTDRPDGEAFGQNSGLGLSISRQIIEAHGGRLTVQNAAPPLVGLDAAAYPGACFIITLPVINH